MSDAAEALDISTEETELSRTSIGDLLTAVGQLNYSFILLSSVCFVLTSRRPAIDSELDKAAAFLTKTCYSRGDTFNRETLSVLACPASSKHSPSSKLLVLSLSALILAKQRVTSPACSLGIITR